MANINLTYWGLTGIKDTVTVDEAALVDALITAIATDEGLDTNYYIVSKLDEPSKSSYYYSDSSTTINTIGITNGSVLLCTPNQTGSKEQRQIQKLEIAAATRSADGNPRFFYDITQLPNPYNDNGVDPDENPNTGGLVQGRPWVELAAGLYRRTYTGYFNDDPSWFATATQTAAVADSTLAIAATPETTSVQWLGYFVPATTETYTFYTSSDDASYLWIGANAVAGFTTGNALIDNGGLHGSVEVSGTIALTAGLRYAIRIQTGNNGGPGAHATSFSTPTIAQTSTFTNRIFYNPVVNGI
jgi:GLEYA domain